MLFPAKPQHLHIIYIYICFGICFGMKHLSNSQNGAGRHSTEMGGVYCLRTMWRRRRKGELPRTHKLGEVMVGFQTEPHKGHINRHFATSVGLWEASVGFWKAQTDSCLGTLWCCDIWMILERGWFQGASRIGSTWMQIWRFYQFHQSTRSYLCYDAYYIIGQRDTFLFTLSLKAIVSQLQQYQCW